VKQTGADGFLVLKPISSWTDEQWIPPTITTSGYARRPWDGTSWVSGGYTVSRPRATIDVRLFDVAKEDVTWVAASASRAAGMPIGPRFGSRRRAPGSRAWHRTDCNAPR
jgi:hypothetical protein